MRAASESVKDYESRWSSDVSHHRNKLYEVGLGGLHSSPLRTGPSGPTGRRRGALSDRGDTETVETVPQYIVL